jgi:NADP-dependent aldehyde dehydrogenase
MTLCGLSLIAGQRAATHGAPQLAIAAADGSRLDPPYYAATPADLDRAAYAAAAAFEVYGRLGGADKANLLRAIADRLEAAGAAIVARAGLETALPPARLTGELGRTCGQLRLFADLVAAGDWVEARIDHGDPQRKPLPKPDLRSMLRPLGPVAVFAPSNFPLAYSVAGGDTASALAAGCPVIVKAHHGHLGTSELVGQCLAAAVAAAGLPGGVFSLLFGPGREIGQALARHPLVKAIGFTGSQAAGRALMDAAAARPEPIPVYAEMGSINPVFLLPGAMVERGPELAAGLHASLTLGVGQFCTNPGLVVVRDDDDAADFLARLTELVKATAPGTMLSAEHCRGYREGLERQAARAGVRQLAQAATTIDRAGAALLATDAAAFLAERAIGEEVFGPVTLVVLCADQGQMLEVARALEGQLTATVWATEAELEGHAELLAVLETRAGRVIFNGWPTGVEVCPAMVHGGPYPATSDGRTTSVGTRAISRFARAVSWQNCPEAALPPELREANPQGIRRLTDGV